MKTPEEMAKEYASWVDAGSHAYKQGVHEGFLAGYHTAYNMAYECGFEEGLKAQKTLTDIQAKLKKTNENT